MLDFLRQNDIINIMISLAKNTIIPDEEIKIQAVRAQGAGGQNVNKVSPAIHLRFDIPASSLPDFYKEKLLKLKDSRISKDGIIIIKAQQFRTQKKNKDDAVARLEKLIKSAAVTRKKRKPTKPTKASKEKRLDSKARQSKHKALRGKVAFD